MQFLPRQLHQQLEARRCLRTGQLLLRGAARCVPLRQTHRREGFAEIHVSRSWAACRRDAPLADRQASRRELFTSRDNGRFARTFVNRIWDRLFGRGIVPTCRRHGWRALDPELLDWLAADFAEHGYDIQCLIERIMTSRRLPVAARCQARAGYGEYVFRGPYPRRLTAEQFADAVAAITGEWQILRDPKPEPGVFAASGGSNRAR